MVLKPTEDLQALKHLPASRSPDRAHAFCACKMLTAEGKSAGLLSIYALPCLRLSHGCPRGRKALEDKTNQEAPQPPARRIR